MMCVRCQHSDISLKHHPIFSFLYLSKMLTFFCLIVFNLSMREAFREALGNNSAIVGLVSLSIVYSATQQETLQQNSLIVLLFGLLVICLVV